MLKTVWTLGNNRIITITDRFNRPEINRVTVRVKTRQVITYNWKYHERYNTSNNTPVIYKNEFRSRSKPVWNISTGLKYANVYYARDIVNHATFNSRRKGNRNMFINFVLPWITFSMSCIHTLVVVRCRPSRYCIL